jgi:hypothetical protein
MSLTLKAGAVMPRILESDPIDAGIPQEGAPSLEAWVAHRQEQFPCLHGLEYHSEIHRRSDADLHNCIEARQLFCRIKARI